MGDSDVAGNELEVIEEDCEQTGNFNRQVGKVAMQVWEEMTV